MIVPYQFPYFADMALFQPKHISHQAIYRHRMLMPYIILERDRLMGHLQLMPFGSIISNAMNMAG